MDRSIVRIQGAIRRFAWGSRSVLADLQGRPAPTEEPEAELWFGAHPLAPAHVLGDGGVSQPLDEVIATDPVATLGPEAAEKFGGRLPFLLKILAVEHPLSLQVHPTAAQARSGFEREETDGPRRDAPERTYRDPWPKPELLVALTQVDALCGFRDLEAILGMLDRLDVPALAPIAATLRAEGSTALPTTVARLLTWPAASRPALVADIATAAQRLASAGDADATIAHWLVHIAAQYPDDPGVAVVLLLDLLQLAPGDAVFVPAGALHAYLRGTGVEVMAGSDNVVRGGLTAKHVDVDGLLDVLGDEPVRVSRITPQRDGAEQVFTTPARQFRLTRLDLDETDVILDRRGPEMVLAIDAPLEIETEGQRLRLDPAQAAFLRADAGKVRLHGRGRVFRAGIGAL